MKRIAVLLALFCVGLLVSSFALADDGGGKGKGRDKESTTATSTNGKGKGKKCHNVSLKGKAAATTFTLTVDKANKAGRDLKTATITFSGKVNVNAVMCSGDATGAAASASTLQLRNLKVAKPAAAEADDD